MKEQIEEIARIICTPTANKGNCEKCGFKKHCSKFDDATDLYNAGYRKQSVGVWRGEIRERCDWRGKKQKYFQPNSCSLCHEPVVERTSYCPNCGAKMKGGAE